MAELKVTIVDTLGAIVAFKPKEVQVLKSVYDTVPPNKQEEFENVCKSAHSMYTTKVAEVKATGEKPKSAAIKTEVLATLLRPWLVDVGANPDAKPAKVVNPKVVEGGEKVSSVKVIRPVKHKAPEVVLTEEMKKEAEELWGGPVDEAELEAMAPKKEEPITLESGEELQPAQSVEELLADLGDELDF